jgi:serine/threonine-protein kinase
MLLSDGTIKVTDFGIARFAKRETRTMTEKAIGSVHYISPEQAKGDVTSTKADLYSVGVMLYEMTTGQLPFEADNAVSVAIMQLQVEPKPPIEINEDIPRGLQEITLKAMKKDPNQRFSSAADMLEAMLRFQKDPSVRFDYKYFIDDKPTKYVDAINSVRSRQQRENYDDNYEYKEERSRNSKHIYTLIGIGIAVLVFALGLTVFGLLNHFSSKPSEVDIPDFIGQKFNDIKDNKEFVFSTTQDYDPSKAENIILDQDPKAGSKKVKTGTKITLTINSSQTPVAIPHLKGLSENDAKAKLKELGLTSEVLYKEDSETAKGIVSASDPSEGEQAYKNSSIKIYVSSGPAAKKVTVPSVLNKSITEAKELIIQNGLKINKILNETSDKPKDTVISTDPMPGAKVDEGSAVSLVISSGEDNTKKIETIKVDMPKNVNREVQLKVYINGKEDTKQAAKIHPNYASSQRITVDPANGEKQTVVVELDSKKYREYKVNFKAETKEDRVKVTKYEYGTDKPITPEGDNTQENTKQDIKNPKT